MTTTTVPITITCPDWCADTAQYHAAELPVSPPTRPASSTPDGGQDV